MLNNTNYYYSSHSNYKGLSRVFFRYSQTVKSAFQLNVSPLFGHCKCQRHREFDGLMDDLCLRVGSNNLNHKYCEFYDKNQMNIISSNEFLLKFSFNCIILVK